MNDINSACTNANTTVIKQPLTRPSGLGRGPVRPGPEGLGRGPVPPGPEGLGRGLVRPGPEGLGRGPVRPRPEGLVRDLFYYSRVGIRASTIDVVHVLLGSTQLPGRG